MLPSMDPLAAPILLTPHSITYLLLISELFFLGWRLIGVDAQSLFALAQPLA